jgi:hypothetical protein
LVASEVRCHPVNGAATALTTATELRSLELDALIKYVATLKTPRKPYNVAFGPVVLDKPFDLHLGVEFVVVWAIGGGHGVNLAKQDEVDRHIKKLPWVMILRLNVEKRQP